MGVQDYANTAAPAATAALANFRSKVAIVADKRKASSK